MNHRRINSYNQSPVYERLYNQHVEQKNSPKIDGSLVKFTFKPQILSTAELVGRENTKVDDILYNDALRRQRCR
jgi:hypothetical protein